MGTPISYQLRGALLGVFQSHPQTIYNKFTFTKEKDICIFLDRKVLSPCHFVVNAFLSASLHWTFWYLGRERRYLVNEDKLCVLAEICKGRAV
jgi:hypothetical protein